MIRWTTALCLAVTVGQASVASADLIRVRFDQDGAGNAVGPITGDAVVDHFASYGVLVSVEGAGDPAMVSNDAITGRAEHDFGGQVLTSVAPAGSTSALRFEAGAPLVSVTIHLSSIENDTEAAITTPDVQLEIFPTSPEDFDITVLDTPGVNIASGTFGLASAEMSPLPNCLGDRGVPRGPVVEPCDPFFDFFELRWTATADFGGPVISLIEFNVFPAPGAACPFVLAGLGLARRRRA